MSNEGIFEIEAADIVKLLPSRRNNERTGYVHVGANSVFLHLRDDGSLCVEIHARGKEGPDPLASASVTRDQIASAGGEDFDR